MKESSLAKATKAGLPRKSSAAAGFLQRACVCGRHGWGECSTCRDQQCGTIQHAAVSTGATGCGCVPPIVQDVTGSPGHPLDPATRLLMEKGFARNVGGVTAHAGALPFSPLGASLGPSDDQYEREARSNAQRFGQPLTSGMRERNEGFPRYDFSKVRIHADARAAESARAVDALAYTMGNHIAFGEGQYAPTTPRGQSLLAHELTHVLQQAHHQPAMGRLQRVGVLESIGRFFRNIGVFFGAEGSYGDDELQDYLAKIDKADHIEGGYDSDNKARAVVRKWKAASGDFSLSARQKKLLVMEMRDGWVSDADKEGILDILEGSSAADLSVIFAGRGVDARGLEKDLTGDKYQKRLQTFFNTRIKGGTDAASQGKLEPIPPLDLKKMDAAQRRRFIMDNFPASEQALARKILDDLAEATDQLDFADDTELKNEIKKRVRTSKVMRESQDLYGKAFEYPNHEAAKRCVPGQEINPRVNKEAEGYWGPVRYHSRGLYFFELSPLGKQNAYAALTKLFHPQSSVCDMTLIHCDYLATVVHLRAFAETIGAEEFNDRVRKGKIHVMLTYYGFQYLEDLGYDESGKNVSLQEVRPTSEQNLVIGDHVIFWNHLAYDGLNTVKRQAWRLENAILVDKRPNGEDLFEGHGSGRRTNRQMRRKLMDLYNELAKAAVAAAAKEDSNEPKTREAGKKDREQTFPLVRKAGAEWIVLEPNEARPTKSYKLRVIKTEDDPDLLGLHDPLEPSKLSRVKRPVESRVKAPIEH